MLLSDHFSFFVSSEVSFDLGYVWLKNKDELISSLQLE
jgi:hypothetical protein